MSTVVRIRPVAAGERAPSFALPAVNREGVVSLDDYRGKSHVLVALFRGFHCPFCRRQLSQLGHVHEKVRAAAVETLAVVNTELERARLYFRYHPARFVVLADPDVMTHRAFGVPKTVLTTPGAEGGASDGPVVKVPREEFLTLRINPTGELPEPLSPLDAGPTLNEMQGFTLTEADERIKAAHRTQMVGHFLIDREGIVRWTHVEAQARIADVCKFPSADEFLAAVRLLAN